MGWLKIQIKLYENKTSLSTVVSFTINSFKSVMASFFVIRGNPVYHMLAFPLLGLYGQLLSNDNML